MPRQQGDGIGWYSSVTLSEQFPYLIVLLILSLSRFTYSRNQYESLVPLLALLSGDIDAEGADGGRDAVPGHEVRQPDAAAHHAHPDRAGQRDRAPHPPVHHHRPEDQGHAAADARQRRRGGLSSQTYKIMLRRLRDTNTMSSIGNKWKGPNFESNCWKISVLLQAGPDEKRNTPPSR